jgi:hypothetical protein
MTWHERLQQAKSWPGWRRHAPVAGSVAVHVVGAVVAMATLGAASGAPVRPPPPPPEAFIAIDLVAELPPEAGVTPPPRTAAPRPDASTDTAPPDPRKRAQPSGPALPGPAAPAPSGGADGDTVYIPPSIMVGPGPAGLQGLTSNDRCSGRYGPKPKDCPSDLAGRVGTMDSLLPRSKDDLAQHFADYMPTCPYRVGCEPGVRRTVNGSYPAGRPPPGSADDRGAGTPQAGGPAGLGGLHDSVGRLGFNPDHTDSGFGD